MFVVVFIFQQKQKLYHTVMRKLPHFLELGNSHFDPTINRININLLVGQKFTHMLTNLLYRLCLICTVKIHSNFIWVPYIYFLKCLLIVLVAEGIDHGVWNLFKECTIVYLRTRLLHGIYKLILGKFHILKKFTRLGVYVLFVLVIISAR